MIKEKKKSKIGLFIVIVLIATAAMMFYMAFREQIPYWISDYKSSKVQKSYTNFTNDENENVDRSSRPVTTEEAKRLGLSVNSTQIPQDWNGIDWTGLQKMNPDIVGWIRIPDTAVNYAILKGTNNDYYLHHHMDGSENILGSIFLSKGSKLTDAHTIMYGHNMASGQMFGQLSEYEDVNFWSNHPYVYVYTPDRTMQCDIYSVYRTKDNSDTYTLGYTLNSNDYIKWVKYTEECSIYQTEFRPTGNEQIFTLSTCADYGEQNDRFVVNCFVAGTEEKSNFSLENTQ